MLALFPFLKRKFDVFKDGGLKGGKRVNPFDGYVVQDGDVRIHDANLPKMENVMEGHHVGNYSCKEMVSMPLVLELGPYLFSSSPVARLKSSGLGEELYYLRHGGLLRVAKLRSISMRPVDKKMLVEKDRIEVETNFIPTWYLSLSKGLVLLLEVL